MSRFNNLTLASSAHLLKAGHITPMHHAKIVASIKKPRKLGAIAKFGSMIPQAQQAQAPIPGAPAGMGVPAGTATGYGDDE